MTTQVPPDLLQTPFRKNAIINGMMDIWQRGTSIAIINTVVTLQCDRFSAYNDRSTAAATYLRSTDVPTFAQCGTTLNYSTEIDITTALVTPSATNEAVIFYNVEGYDYARLHGGNATLSFWVKSNKTGIYSLSLRNDGSTRTYVVEYTIDVADTWEKKIITMPLTESTGTWNTTNGKGVNISWALMAAYATTSTFGEWLSANTPYSVNNVNLFDNTANYFRLAGVQFEKGDIATEFERRIHSEELAMCQRYYYETSTAGTVVQVARATTTAQFVCTSINFPVEMRTLPTVVASDPALVGGTMGTLGFDRISTLNARPLSSNSSGMTVGQAVYALFDYTADAEI